MKARSHLTWQVILWASICGSYQLSVLDQADAAEPPKLLLMAPVPHGVSPQIARSLTNLLELEIERGGLFSVISEQDLRTLLRIEEHKMLLGQDEQSSQRLAKIAQNLKVPFVVTGSIGRVGMAYVLSLELIDTEQVKVLHRATQTLVGSEEELIGSLGSAVLSITLQEKGVSPDISAELIDKLEISRKEKDLILALSPAYEIPIGTQISEDALLVFRPTFFHLRLDAELPLRHGFRLVGSLSIGTTLGETFVTEDNHVTGIFDPESKEQLGYRLQAAQVSLDYSALRIPMNVGIKIAPDTGRFTPYFLAGVGVSWQGYRFSSSTVNLLREHLPDHSCPPPFTEYTPPGQQLPQCEIRGQGLYPEGDISYFGIDTIAAIGFDWLASHHFGIRVEVRYHMTYALKQEEEMRLLYTGESEPYWVTTDQGSNSRVDRYFELFAVQKVHHGLSFSAGLILYW